MSQRDTLIFDGACGVCTAAAEWVGQRGGDGRLRIVPYQTADLDRLSPGLTREMTEREPFYRLVAANRGRLSAWLGMTTCAAPEVDASHDP